MKKSNAEKFFDILSELDESLLTEVLQADDKKSFKKKKSKDKIIIFRPAFIKIAILFLCVAIVASAVILGKPKDVYTSVGNDNEVTSVFSNESPDASSRQKESSKKAPSTPEHNKNTYNTSSNAHKNAEEASNTNSDDYDPYDSEYIPDAESSAEESSSENENYGDYYIDSIDKLNFYSVKKVIEEYDVFSVLNINNAINPMVLSRAPVPIRLLNNSVYYYEVNRDTVFNITMETYFTIRLNNKNGFLAKKLGGTGLVEVVITENNLDDMITFKRGGKYYSCLLNSGSTGIEDGSKRTVKFSTHKYIKGYNVVKNFEQHNFLFQVQYENLNIVGFNAIDLGTTASGNNQTYEVDDITLIADHCVVMFIKRSFTIEQLEGYFNSN